MGVVEDWARHLRAIHPEAGPDVTLGPWSGASWFGDPAKEYNAARSATALHDRSYRGLLELTGADRIDWLHNLTTNDMKRLSPGEGCRAFALNVQGRILFALNVLVQSDSVWLDIDRRWAGPAGEHFGKYTIVEDVSITDRSDDFIRMGLTGPGTAGVLEQLGAPPAAWTAALGLRRIVLADCDVPCFRLDIGETPAAELFAPADRAPAIWGVLRAHPGVTPIGFDALNTLRIEAGVAWPFTEITNDVLPAETNQFGCAVSISKGCYLGQEVVERMRTRGSVARRLVLVSHDGDRPVDAGSPVYHDDEKIGHVTSACVSPARRGPAALAYVRAARAVEGTEVRMQDATGRLTGRIVVCLATA